MSYLRFFLKDMCLVSLLIKLKETGNKNTSMSFLERRMKITFPVSKKTSTKKRNKKEPVPAIITFGIAGVLSFFFETHVFFELEII